MEHQPQPHGFSVDVIRVCQAPTSDSRTCDTEQVSKDELMKSTLLHKRDVVRAFNFLVSRLLMIAEEHDHTKVTDFSDFYHTFKTTKGAEFKNSDWWKLHLTERHHLNDSCPEDVNLLDVLEMLVDGIVAGAARVGPENVWFAKLSPEILQRAVKNTQQLLLNNVVVDSDDVICHMGSEGCYRYEYFW